MTVDVSNPYMALKPEFMEGEWALIKSLGKKRLYYGEKVLTWCQHCETAVAKHECEYKNVKDVSIYVKFPRQRKAMSFSHLDYYSLDDSLQSGDNGKSRYRLC